MLYFNTFSRTRPRTCVGTVNPTFLISRFSLIAVRTSLKKFLTFSSLKKASLSSMLIPKNLVLLSIPFFPPLSFAFSSGFGCSDSTFLISSSNSSISSLRPFTFSSCSFFSLSNLSTSSSTAFRSSSVDSSDNSLIKTSISCSLFSKSTLDLNSSNVFFLAFTLFLNIKTFKLILFLLSAFLLDYF